MGSTGCVHRTLHTVGIRGWSRRLEWDHSKVLRQQKGCSLGHKLLGKDLETWSLFQLAC